MNLDVCVYYEEARCGRRGNILWSIKEGGRVPAPFTSCSPPLYLLVFFCFQLQKGFIDSYNPSLIEEVLEQGFITIDCND